MSHVPCARSSRSHAQAAHAVLLLNYAAVWWGAVAGIILSCVAGGIFAAVFYLAQTRLFQVRLKLHPTACALVRMHQQAQQCRRSTVQWQPVYRQVLFAVLLSLDATARSVSVPQ